MDTQNIKQWIVDNAKDVFIRMFIISASIAFCAVVIHLLENYSVSEVMNDGHFQIAIEQPCYREHAKNLLVGGKTNLLIREHNEIIAKCRKSHAELLNTTND